ncbi:MAG TPA: hypothetical protein PLP73_03400 [Candidatus Absconditabacterales bacterium]|nr:hypothetical protein [Candidatus Absconditabacterales bacterium]
MLEKAQKILQVGSVSDIQEFMPQLIQAYCKLDIEQATLEKSYEIYRIERYVELKKKKKEKKNSYSDKDIDIISKKQALDKYGDYVLNKRIVAHYKMYITELSQRKIDLQVLDKAMRMGVGN